MSLKDPTRDAHGYPLQGVDVVPVRPKPSKLSQIMKLLQEANIRKEGTRPRGLLETHVPSRQPGLYSP